jgi:hypothetical protein
MSLRAHFSLSISSVSRLVNRREEKQKKTKLEI